jgi:acyl dehydratase
MAEGSLITPEIQAMVGQETDLPGSVIIDQSCIERYAEAVGDLNPLYLDQDYARKTDYGRTIAPPTLVFDLIPTFTDLGDDGRDLTRVTLPGLRLARGGNEYQFFEPALPGDVVKQKRKIVDIYERDSKKLGKIMFMIYDTTYTNQQGKLLSINRETMMFFR